MGKKEIPPLDIADFTSLYLLPPVVFPCKCSPVKGFFCVSACFILWEMSHLFELQPRNWNLVISPPRLRLLVAIAYIAYHTDLVVLDCGRQFDSSIVARAARGRQEIIDRIKVQRAFTCYEVAKLIERLPSGKTPIIILDFLSTFHDENVKTQNRKFLLETLIRHFQRLSHGAGLAISVNLPPLSQDSIFLFERLKAVAPHVSSYASMEDKTSQLSLFQWET